MPFREEVIYVYSCDICKEKFSASLADEARYRAIKCEFKGKPKIHSFAKGIMTAGLKIPIGYWDTRTLNILDLHFEKRTHKPQYWVEIIESSSFCRKGDTFIVYGEDIRFIHNFDVVQIGCE